jgi:hypothetical protein
MVGFPYRLYGGALRPDAISGLDPRFSEALTRLYYAAPPEVQRELALNSAYRSAAVQQELWNRSDKTGRTVARPGESRHQFGTAADLYGFGLGGNTSVSQATRDWVNANAAAQGLYFPMSYEPWHIQLRDARPGQPNLYGDAEAVAGTSPLATTLASATLEPERREGPLENFLSTYARSAATTRRDRDIGPGLVSGPPPPESPVDLQPPSAIPAGYPTTSDLGSLAPQLADLFKVKDIGTIQPGRRF